MRLTTSHCKNLYNQKHDTGPRDFANNLERYHSPNIARVDSVQDRDYLRALVNATLDLRVPQVT